MRVRRNQTIIRQQTNYLFSLPQERVIVVSPYPFWRSTTREHRGVTLQINFDGKSSGVTLSSQNALDLATALTFYAEGLHHVR